jgi:SAM-dependent methyltransferase
VCGDTPRYDSIGHDYARLRREDPRLRALIHGALGAARTVVNVGAGTGSYEPSDRHVIAIEPSDVMAAQRPREIAPAIRASAGALPLRDASVDAAMAILTVHHWDQERDSGIRELRRVARGPVVILTYDPDVCTRMWLIQDYLPELRDLDQRSFPPPHTIAALLGGRVDITPVPLPRDCDDWMLGAMWAHPERVLDERARAVTSGFARMAPDVVERVVQELTRDLANGNWGRRHGELRRLAEHDVGLRLLVGLP